MCEEYGKFRIHCISLNFKKALKIKKFLCDTAVKNWQLLVGIRPARKTTGGELSPEWGNRGKFEVKVTLCWNGNVSVGEKIVAVSNERTSYICDLKICNFSPFPHF